MTERNLLVVDLETSGPNPSKHDVLAVGLVPFATDLPTALFYVRCRPATEVAWSAVAREHFVKYRREWDAKALDPPDACAAIESYIATTFDHRLVTPVGHNVGFDVAFLRRLAFLGGRDELAGVSHRAVDTHTLLFALVLRGRLPERVLTSDGAFAHFGIIVPREMRHTALGDAVATRELAGKLLEL